MSTDTIQHVAIGPRSVGDRPLTDVQRRIWASQRLAPASPVSNMATAHRIRGAVDPDVVADAFDLFVRATEVLRSVVVDRPGSSPQARILHAPPARVEVIDVATDERSRWMASRIAVPLDATRCCYDAALLRHGHRDWTLWIDLHHVVTDAASSALVYEAVAATYGRLVGSIPAGHDAPTVSFYDVVDGDVDVDESPARAPLSPYGPRGDRTTRVATARLGGGLVAEMADAYPSFSRELSATVALTTACAVTLSRLEGRPDVTVGIPIHHRSGARARVIGPAMDIHPVSVTVEVTHTFRTIAAAVQRSVLTALRPAAARSSAELDAVVNVQTARYGDFAGMPTTSEWIRPGHVDPAHPIRVHVHDYGAGPRIDVDVNEGLSRDGSHRAFPAHLERTLRAALADPGAPIGQHDLVDDDDRKRLLGLNPPAAPDALLRPIHEVIADRWRAVPEHVTAEHDGVEVTTGDLDRRSAALEAHLATLGVGRGDRVGVRMARSVGLLVAVHGVLRRGAAFVMLDPDDPPSRHDAIIADSAIEVIVDELTLQDAQTTPPSLPDRSTDTVELDDIAYVLYTSGSTGTPKGVPVPHRGLADYLHHAAQAFTPEAGVVMPLYTPVVFDLAITSLFLPQLTGGRTVVIDGDPLSTLGRIAGDQRLTVLKATPSQLEILARMVTSSLGLRVVIVGGEAFRRPVAEAIVAHCEHGVRIFNEYGPTEAVVGCMLHEWDADVDIEPDVPIGRATPGAEVFVLDAAGRLSPPGAWGELYVRRPGMPTGYQNLPEVTSERWTVPPAIGGAALYRTGDRVRVSGDVVVYGGRWDDQLSVGGARVEAGEIEAALLRHPGITRAVVRVWTPDSTAVRRCRRCGLGTDVPGVTIDSDQVCSVCAAFDRVEPQARRWFKTAADLDDTLARVRARTRGDIDALHLLSGGKDSTYALYQLVERGWRVHALTLDNGYISAEAKANIGRTVADLGIGHEYTTTPSMTQIFRDSLERFSNVCNGCYKTIYTLGVARAHELGIPAVVTGLSRGQFFETRLLPHQFEAGRFDPEAIDRAVLEARRAYHRTRDAVTDSLPQQALFERDDLDVLAEIEFVDFYRYVDVELHEMLRFLEDRAPWVRPSDTGRSTNCLVNVAGIHVHRTERGFHNYAEPYSWDVRLGHKTRDEALEELDDHIDEREVQSMLDAIGYTPVRPEVLTAWYSTTDGDEIDHRLLAAHLRGELPARAVPKAFVHVEEIPLAVSAKLDPSRLPRPSSRHLGSTAYVAPATTTEADAAAIWERLLGVERVGRDDDFFDLGGASLLALETVAASERHFGVDLPDALVFTTRTLTAFAAAIDEMVGAGALVETIPRLDPATPAPLGPGEESLLFVHRSDPDDTRYNVTRLYEVAADVDIDRLAAAFGRVVDRHSTLHTSFDPERTRLPTNRALFVAAMPVGELDDVVDRLRRMPFDLDAGPLVRVWHRRSADGVWHLLIGLHHATIDAGTFDVLWREVDLAYHGGELPDIEVTYAEHAAWQRSRSTASARFWSDRPDPTADVAFPAPGLPEPDGYRTRPAAVTATDIVSTTGTTPFVAALTAAAIVLSASTVDELVEIGVTASTKDHVAAEPLIGYFLNSLPLVVRVDPNSRGVDALAAVDAVVTDAVAHRAYPFDEMVRDARRDGRRPPRLSQMLAYERLAPARFGDAVASHQILASGTAVNDLTFFVQQRDDDLQLGVEHRGSVIGGALAEALLEAFDRTLTDLCRHPGTTVADLRRPFVAVDVSGPELDDEPDPPLWAIVDRARREPGRVAVRDALGTTVTYGELVERAMRLAARLRSGHPGARRVGVSVSRSARLIEAIVGVQLSGAAYVPIDPSLGRERQARIGELAGVDVVVVDASTIDDVAGTVDTVNVDTVIETVNVDTVIEGSAEGSDGVALPGRDDPAYVIFTSGSTGEPAGIEVTHGRLAASTGARPAFYGDAPPARFLLTPSIGFDSSMVGIFWPLATGGTVVVAGDDDVHDVDRLGELVVRHDVTHLLMVPSLYRALLRRRAASMGGLHTAIVAGEACPAELVAEHHRLLPSVELVNEYGPSEATVWVTAHRCEPVDATDGPVPIGLPIAGATVRVADRRQHPVAAGSPGELLVSGPGVVPGYLTGRADESFVEADGRRWYRTGDLVRFDDAGRLVFLGRLDDQLNVGGMRLEPAEVEGVLLELPTVTDAVVVAAEVAGREVLVAHLVAERGVVDLDTVRSAVSSRLGAAAAPRQIGIHQSLPRTANGKIDRSAAATLPVDRVAHDTTASTTLVAVWERALGRTGLGPGSDFFAEGGDSLAAVEIVTALGRIVGREVPVSMLLSASTPARMAAALGVGAGAGADADAGTAVSVLTMREGRSGGPTVVLTPAWDGPMGYRALADAFDDDVSVYALVVGEDSQRPLTVAELNDIAVPAVAEALDRRIAGTDGRPVVVLGWSIGGVVAFDLGRRLAADHHVSVVLVDTIFPGEHRHVWSNRWWKYKSLLRPGSLGEAMRELRVMTGRRVRGYGVRVGRQLMRWGGEPVERPVRSTASGVPFAALDAAPEPSDVPVLLLRADTTSPHRTEIPWATVATSLRVEVIEGRHRGFDSVMGADRVNVIVEHVQREHRVHPDR